MDHCWRKQMRVYTYKVEETIKYFKLISLKHTFKKDIHTIPVKTFKKNFSLLQPVSIEAFWKRKGLYKGKTKGAVKGIFLKFQEGFMKTLQSKFRGSYLIFKLHGCFLQLTPKFSGFCEIYPKINLSCKTSSEQKPSFISASRRQCETLAKTLTLSFSIKTHQWAI